MSKQERIAEIENDLTVKGNQADCGILDIDDANYWMQVCEEYKTLLWEEKQSLPDNHIGYCRVRGRAAEVIESKE